MSFDAIIVGSGATGSWAAKLLTERGLTVALLEAGRPAAAEQAPHGGAEQNSAGARQTVQSRCYAYDSDTRHLFVDDVDNPYEAPPGAPFTWIRMHGCWVAGPNYGIE